MDRVADYVLLRELGRGEHGEVHLARTPRRLGFAADTLAVKVLPLAGSDGFDALVDELSCFAALHCPYLVPMYDVGMDAGVVFYPMRHEPGGPLSAPARELTGREQLLAVARAARGAHEMDDAGLVHRGIGPYEHPARPGRRRPGRTVGPAPAGARVHGWRPGAGRPGWPEFVDLQLRRGCPAGRASDVWSLGVTLHLVLTGHGLFPAMMSADPVTAARMYLKSQPEPGEELRRRAGDRRHGVAPRHHPPASGPRRTSPRRWRSWSADQDRHDHRRRGDAS